MPRRDNCPTCDGTKDKRAYQCSSCRFTYNNPRLGTGVGERLSTNGYVMLMVDRKEVYKHRHVMEEHLGRKLSSNEHVHHIDHDRTNNDISNLELLSCRDHHCKHTLDRERDSCGRFV